MKQHLYTSLLSVFLLLLAGTACTSDITDNTSSIGKPAEVVATIGSASVETKTIVRNDDKISYAKFDTNDAIGIFSTGGLDLNNVKLTYKDGSFKADGTGSEFVWKEGNADDVYAYYPYPATQSGNTINIWRAASAETDKKWNAGFEDLLAAYVVSIPNGSLISLGFKHQFAMLIIERGTGFDDDKITNKDVSIKLNYKVSKQAELDVTNNTNVEKGYILSEDNNGVDEITANPGKFKASTGTTETDCYYVIIPVGQIDGNNVTVSTITLYNNAGVKMTVPFSMSYAIESNNKYRVIVKMRDNQAIIEPEEIRRWDEESISIEKPAGIENIEEFDKWMSAYNTNREDQELGKYGTYDLATSKWTFLLLDSIDLSGLNNKSLNYVIKTFSDHFDGQGHTLHGLKLNGTADNRGFFGSLNGTVKNLKLENIQISNTGSNTGCIAGTSTGSIENCHVLGINSLVIGTGNTGGLIGLLENGSKMTSCSSSAFVSGTTGSSGLLFGKNEETSNVTNCISTGTIITK